MFSLEITQDGQVRRASMERETLRIGAAADNDLRLDSHFVSNYHAELKVVGEQVEVRDAGSLNGVFVAGQRVASSLLDLPATMSLGADVSLTISRLEPDEMALAPGVRPAGRPVVEMSSNGPETARATTPDGGLSDELAAAVLRVVAETQDPSTAIPRLLRATLAATGLENALALVRPSASSRELLVRHAEGPDGSLETTMLDVVLDRLERGEQDGWLEQQVEGRTLHLAFLSRASEEGLILLVFAGSARLTTDLRPLARALDIVLGSGSRRPAAEPTSPREPQTRFRLSLRDEELFESQAPETLALHDRINAALTSDLPVLLTGETGVGKELYAQAIHAQSTRKEGPLQTINSSAIPSTLLEGLLFGAVEGAATGVSAREGLLQSADGGTFFLDEIGELSLPLQAKLLRALDRREVHPVGAPTPIPIDVRFISATNRDLLAEVEAGRFRKDLYFRLTGHRFVIGPLRERRCDIARLVDHFLQRECLNAGRHVPGVSVKAMNALVAHHWPGNVRELEMLIRLLVHGSTDAEPLRFEQLPEDMRAQAGARSVDGALDTLSDQSLDGQLDRYQRELLVKTLERCGGNRSTAAEQLGISRGRLRRLTRRLGIPEG